MLVAQATVEGLALVTRDADIQRYAVEFLVP
jgi:PIN domain nuclease of toxin-antitoxin system